MDYLPVELVLIILTWGGPLYIKINRLVCRAWRDLLPRPKSSRPPLEEAAREGWSDVFDFIADRLRPAITSKTMKYILRNGWNYREKVYQQRLPCQRGKLVRKLVRKKLIPTYYPGLIISYSIMEGAVIGGYFEFVKAFLSTFNHIRLGELCALAFLHLHIAKWLHSQGYRSQLYHLTKDNMNEEFIDWYVSTHTDLQGVYCQASALLHSTLELRQKVIQLGGQYDVYILRKCATRGRWDIIDEAYATGMLPAADTLIGIIKSGNVDRLRQALAKGRFLPLWFSQTIEVATNPEMLRCLLQYAKDNFNPQFRIRLFLRCMEVGNLIALSLVEEFFGVALKDCDLHDLANLRCHPKIAKTSLPRLYLKEIFLSALYHQTWSHQDLVWLFKELSKEVNWLTRDIVIRVLQSQRIKLFRKMLRLTDVSLEGVSVLNCVLISKKYQYLLWVVNLLETGRIPHCRNYITVQKAIASGNLRLLHWLIDNDYPLDPVHYVEAATQGNLTIMNILYERGVALTSAIYYRAYQNHNFHIIEWALARDCPWHYCTLTYFDTSEDIYIHIGFENRGTVLYHCSIITDILIDLDNIFEPGKRPAPDVKTYQLISLD
jgi:hypothetical protein